MIHVKDHDMPKPFEHRAPKHLALLESSRAHLFREEILHKLPAEKLFHLDSKHSGRRIRDLYAMLGIALLQQHQDLTDEEAIRQFAFNIEWQRKVLCCGLGLSCLVAQDSSQRRLPLRSAPPSPQSTSGATDSGPVALMVSKTCRVQDNQRSSQRRKLRRS